MTTIAWDGDTLAADKAAINGGLVRTVTKIFKHNGQLMGFCGDASFGQQMMAWYTDGAKIEDFPAAQREESTWQTFFVIAAPHTPVLVYERTPCPISIEDQYYVCGSGRDFALGAMYAGKTAVEAVAIACKLDAGSGQGIDVLSFDVK